MGRRVSEGGVAPSFAHGWLAEDVATQRDWALLHAWKVLPGPEAVLQSLREQRAWTMTMSRGPCAG